MSQAKVELLVDSSQVKSATNDLKNLAAQGAVVDKSAKNGTESLGKFGRTAGQAGIQISQLTGQIQGGTSAFVAISQQAADLGFILGVPLLGAVISIAAAFSGPLVEAMKGAKDELKDTVEQLPADVQKFLDEVQKKFDSVDFSNRADLARSELGKLNTEYEKAAELVSSLSAELKDLETFGPSSKYVKSGEQFTGAWRDARFALVAAEENLAKIQLKLEKVDEITKSGLGVKSLDELSGSTDTAATATERLIQQQRVQQEALTNGELAARLLAAAFASGKQSVDEMDASLRSNIETTYKLEQQQRSATESTKALADELKAQAQADLDLLAEQQSERQRLSKETADALKQDSDDYLAQLETEYQARQAFMQLQGEFDPVEAERQRYAKQLEVIRTYRAQEGADQAAADQAAEDAEKAHQDNLLAIKKQGAQASMAIATGNLQAAGELLGTLSQLAYQGGEKSFTLYKRLAQGQAIVAGALAVIRALAEGGPFLGPALAVATGALVGAQVAIIEKQQYQPRAAGGQVSSSNSYLVGERGPELFTPSSSGMGRITPFNQLMNAANDSGQGNAPVINIANYGGQAEVQSTRYSEADRRWIIDIVAGDMQSRGKTHSAITRSTTAGNRSV